MKKTNVVELRCIAALIKAERLLGSGTKLAKVIGIRKQTLNNWKQKGEIPYRACGQIFVATDGKVAIEELCPQSELLTRRINEITFREIMKKTEEKIIQDVQSRFRTLFQIQKKSQAVTHY